MQDEHTGDIEDALQDILSRPVYWGSREDLLRRIVRMDSELLRRVCAALRVEPGPLDRWSLRLYEAARDEFEWRTKVERDRAGSVDDSPTATPAPTLGAFDAYWRDLKAERPLVVWGARSRFASNQACIDWVCEEIRRRDSSRERHAPRTKEWFVKGATEPEDSVRGWLKRAGVSAEVIARSPSPE